MKNEISPNDIQRSLDFSGVNQEKGEPREELTIKDLEAAIKNCEEGNKPIPELGKFAAAKDFRQRSGYYFSVWIIKPETLPADLGKDGMFLSALSDEEQEQCQNLLSPQPSEKEPTPTIEVVQNLGNVDSAQSKKDDDEEDIDRGYERDRWGGINYK